MIIQEFYSFNKCVLFGIVSLFAIGLARSDESAECKGSDVKTSYEEKNVGVTAPSGHGVGYLQRVRNNSEYAISFFQEKTIHDYLPEDTVIQIVSLRPEYGTKGRLYRVKLVGGAYRLVADTEDASDPSTYLIVSRYVSRTFKDFLGFYSPAANNKFLESGASRNVTFSAASFKDEDCKAAHWFLDGGTIENCAIKSVVSGYLSARGTGKSVVAPENRSKDSRYYQDDAAQASSSSNDNQNGIPWVGKVLAGQEKTTSSPTKPFYSTRPVSSYQAPTPLSQFLPIGGQFFSSLSAEFVGDSLTIVGVDLANDGFSLKIPKQSLVNAQELLNQKWVLFEGQKFRMVDVGFEGAFWGIDRAGGGIRFIASSNSWLSCGPAMRQISACGHNSIWMVDGQEIAYQKNNPLVVLDKSWGTMREKSMFVAPTNDGGIWIVDSSTGHLFFAADGKNWEDKIDANKVFGGAVKKVVMKSEAASVVLSEQGKLFRLHSTTASWRQISLPSSFEKDNSIIDFGLASDGSLVVLVAKNNEGKGLPYYVATTNVP